MKTYQVFSVHTTPGEFKDTTIIIGHFGFVFRENSSREITSFSLCYRFQKAVFCVSVDGRPNLKNKAACLNFCGVIWTGPRIEGSSCIQRSADRSALLTEREVKMLCH